jgi:hypothetical protein
MKLYALEKMNYLQLKYISFVNLYKKNIGISKNFEEFLMNLIKKKLMKFINLPLKDA